MSIDTMFYLGLILLAGLLFGRLVKQIKLPNVTGYLLAGLLLGPYVLKLLPVDLTQQLNFVSELALGFIAFSIGSEFKASYFKKVGLTPVVIALTEGLCAVFFVVGGMLMIGQPLSFSLVIGAIASATAPAATIMVIKQYKAKGPLTQTLLSVVALDDAVALIAFGFSVAIARSISNPGSSLLLSILAPFKELLFAVIIGVALGFLFIVPLRFFKKNSNRLCIAVAFIFLSTALAKMFGASTLLTTMIMGAVLVNFCSSAPDIMKLTDSVTPPIFVMFFVVSGAELNISVLPTIGLVGIVYVVFRVVGKMVGATGGAILMKADKTVKKYLGPTLIPQAGVAIGLTLVAQEAVPEHASVIRAVILCATLIYEIVGPMISKICLQKAGEIKAENM